MYGLSIQKGKFFVYLMGKNAVMWICVLNSRCLINHRNKDMSKQLYMCKSRLSSRKLGWRYKFGGVPSYG